MTSRTGTAQPGQSAPAPTVYQGLSEFEAQLGRHLGYSDWHRVTQEQIDLFAEATGDRQWIHVDAEKAATGPYGKTIAHGYLTLSLVPLLIKQIYRVEGLSMQVNYGVDKLRFPAPVPVDSRIRAGAELVGVERSGNGARATVRVTVEVDGGDRPACVVDTIALMVP
ncbi:MaoC family dehydratase [Mycolicibacterium thermoresistibile]|uniref:Enoyl-CoA hydratase n=2 Tax=Mycolicibacterium thermoresistibile TaxID=1797 RepID=G7CN51_MYCT3|nr:MaoC family dehydratase [Mycolicibacterium thermoresistibile]EHI10540.1 enoyl-CoA hydratase [Mycolicibacterium thermoresistibile ATCC 19527]MCV7189678.1 MaoC family dehydratase [Mycolicibacterium thermoresistibile]GAT15408.1 acyl dehydratase [Mycolicibacterium thermoresistibile]SNW17467.1 enoyl-CoA hydratase [Mycolicibacterium thermoresistibile]